MNQFLIDLQAELDIAKSKGTINNDIESLQEKLNTLKIKTEIDPNLLNDIANKIKNINNGDALNAGQQIGKDISKGITQGLSGGSDVLEGFKRSLKNIGMGTAEIDAIANRIKSLGISIESLNQSLTESTTKKKNNNVLSVDISGVDKFGQIIKLTQQYDMVNGQLIKSIDAVSSANERAAASTNKFLDKQSKAVTDATNKLNKIYQSAIDPSSAKPIKNESNLNNLTNKYNDVTSAIGRMKNATISSFTEEQNAVSKLTTELEIMIRQYKNAETVATSLRTKDIETVKSQYSSKLDNLITNMKSANIYTGGFEKGASNLGNMLSNAVDASELTAFLNGLDKLEAGYKRAAVSANAFNKAQALSAKTDKLKSSIENLQRISPEINKFEAEIRGSTTNVQSLLDSLSMVKTTGEFSVVREDISAFKEAAKAAGIAVTEVGTKSDTSAAKIQKIQTALNANTYDTKLKLLISSYEKLGLTSDEISEKTKNVSIALSELRSANVDNLIEKETTFNNELKTSQNDAAILKTELDKIYNQKRQMNLKTDIQKWLSKNTQAAEEARNALEQYYQELSSGRVSIDKLDYISKELKEIESSQNVLGKLGKSLKDQFAQAGQSVKQWLSIGSSVMLFITKIKSAVNELKEVNTYLTEISKANDQLSDSELAQIGNDSFDIASKYGKSATNYLSAVQEASRAGYEDATGIAELSVAAQGAGDMTQELANQMIIATDKAYKMNGSIEELRSVLDGMNYITNHNAVNMTELSEGMSIVGSTASSFGVDVKELAAALGTMTATTQQSGSEVARAFRAILLNIRQVSDEEEGIGVEGLTKYEKACNALGVKLKETKDGVQALRQPMEVLKELSEEYNKLESSDIRRTNLLNSVGGKVYHVIQKCMIRTYLIAGNA